MSASRRVTLRRVDEALTRPDVRALFEEYKRLFAAATEFTPLTPEHEQAALAAGVQALLTIEAIDPEGALPREAVYRHLVNVAMPEMLPPSPIGLFMPALPVTLPAGRSKGSRPVARQALVDEVRSHPEMTEDEVDRRGVALGWWEDALGDYALRAKRVGRLRNSATN